MDRPLQNHYRRRRLGRRLAAWGIGLGLLVTAILVIPGWMKPSVSRSRVRTAVVDRGPIEATLSATGQVVPAYETLLTSPLATRLERILRQPGAQVDSGEVIAVLDRSEAVTRLEKLEDQISLKRNEREQTELELAKALGELRGRRRLKALDVESLEFEESRNRKLVEGGMVSGDMHRQSQTDLKRARIELDQIDQAIVTEERTLAARLDGLALEIALLEKDREEAARRLRRVEVSADRSGVVTWVLPQEGTAVTEGEAVARVADLSAFRVDASVGDVHATRLTEGMPVTVRVGEEYLPGQVSTVHPTVENGVVTFEVELARPDHPGLRHNLRVDVHPITDSVPQAIRVRRGAYVNVDGVPHVFVVHDDVAVRTPVEFGVHSYEMSQVLSGLQPGEEVILSDMSAHRSAREVRIR